MDASRWQRIQDLFHDALERAPEDRDAFLRAAAAGDDDAIARVRGLLAADTSEGFLDAPVGRIAHRVLDGADEAAAGGDAAQLPRVGPYRLIEPLGEGGTGVVYRAVRDDIGHDVAIKVLRDAWVSTERRERFTREQQTLAKLAHPAIARILDAGVLESGTPWFAMERVAGVPLDAYCRAHALGAAAVVQIVRQVAAAVQHAHERLIIHRDLKPSNILVEATGQPRLLDFGIARQLELTAEPTRTGPARMLTPGYASPEELRGDAPGVQADVYSLGVVLRDLLAATDPAIRVAWWAPSAYRSDRTARRDLETIVRTATEADQALRYATADALVRDLDAWLAGRPLTARPASTVYRLGRFVSRHRRAIAAAALVIAVAAGVGAEYSRRLAAARLATTIEAARVQRLLQFVLGLFEGGEGSGAPPTELRAVTLLERGVSEADALSDPPVQADLYNTLGQAYRELGDLVASDRLLTRELELRRASGTVDAIAQADALVALADLRRVQARFDDAERLVRESQALASALPATHPSALRALTTLGRVQSDRGDYAAAVKTLDQVLAAQPANASGGVGVLTAVKAMADAQFYLGNLDRAERESTRALELARATLGVRHPDVAEARINLGAIASLRGQLPESERQFREAVALLQGWFGDDHPATASAKTSLAQTLGALARDAEGQTLLESALATQTRVFGPRHPKTAFVHNEFGLLAYRRNDFTRATAEFTAAADGYRAAGHPQAGVSTANLGSVHLAAGAYRPAEAAFRRALELFATSLPPDHLNVGVAMVKLGRSVLRQKRAAEAKPLLEDAERILAKQPGGESTWLKAARDDLASLR